MAQLINCEFKIKIIISANMEESSEENIKAVISILHKTAACETNLSNVELDWRKLLKIHVEPHKTGFVSFKRSIWHPLCWQIWKKKKVYDVLERETKSSIWALKYARIYVFIRSFSSS